MKKTTPALLIVDMFSRFDFPEADLIASSALNASKAIARLRQHFKAEGDPVTVSYTHLTLPTILLV